MVHTTGYSEFCGMEKTMTKKIKKPFLPLITYLGKRYENRKFSEAPIFIGGCARSGTTILFSILSAHPEIFCFHKELGIFNPVKYNRHGEPYPGREDRLYTSMLTHKIPKEAKRWCEKSPINIRWIEVIDSYYQGNFKFIHIIRDGRDVILSKHPKRRNTFWVDPERWIQDVSNGLEFESHVNVHTIRYEDLIRNFNDTISGICNFLELPVSHEILNWHDYATHRVNKAYLSEVKQLSDTSIGKWKQEQYAERVKELTKIPEGIELLKKLDYC
jgi:hypothetical protein